MVVRAWAFVVAVSLVGCGSAEPKQDPAPAPAAQGGAPAQGGQPAAVQGKTLHEVVGSIGDREGLNVSVDPRVDGDVDDALRARVAGAKSWREQLELLAFAFDCTVKEQATPKATQPYAYKLTFEERTDVAIDAGAHQALRLIGAFGERKVSFDPSVPDPRLKLDEVGVHWHALIERVVKELGPYVLVEQGEFIEVVPLERKTAKDEGKPQAPITGGLVTAIDGQRVTLAPTSVPGAKAGATVTLALPTGTPHADRVREFLAAAVLRRRWAVVTTDAKGTVTNVVVRTSAKGR